MFDQTVDFTDALLHRGPEHSEEHQDGDDHTRSDASIDTV